MRFGIGRGKQASMRGVTIIEVLLVMAMISVVWVIIAAFLRYGLSSQRSQFEQGTITTTARVQIDRMTTAIREGALLSAAADDITVDGPDGMIRYRLQGASDLSRSVNGGATVVVTRGVQNQSEGVSLFRYYSVGGEKALELNPSDPDFAISTVGRVNVRLLLDIDINQDPGIAEIETEITLRR